MHDLATVSVIQDICPIEGKDRIVLATVATGSSISTMMQSFRKSRNSSFSEKDAGVRNTKASASDR